MNKITVFPGTAGMLVTTCMEDVAGREIKRRGKHQIRKDFIGVEEKKKEMEKKRKKEKDKEKKIQGEAA
jgi:hypothetical protein